MRQSETELREKVRRSRRMRGVEVSACDCPVCEQASLGAILDRFLGP